MIMPFKSWPASTANLDVPLAGELAHSLPLRLPE
jgi:hypothetical protein